MAFLMASEVVLVSLLGLDVGLLASDYTSSNSLSNYASILSFGVTKKKVLSSRMSASFFSYSFRFS